jgi:hypothetical protein
LRRDLKAAALVIFVLFWAAAFVPPLWTSSRPLKDGSGADVINFNCVDTFWERKNFCGLDGIDCKPFEGVAIPFRCPAHCSSVQVLEPRAVGPLDVIYRPLVIGNDVYRGDSWVCASAIHAGVMPDAGGCGRVTLLGEGSPFLEVDRHGIRSIPFDSYFPLSFSITRDSSIQHCSREPRISLLLVSMLFTTTLSLVSASSSVLFFTTFIAIFAHVSFVSDPPTASLHNTSVLPDHMSRFAERLLPSLFLAVVLYRTCVARTLRDLDAHIEKTVLWLGGFWIGALSNYTLDWIPISRLRAHDIAQQPGAAAALAVILMLLVLAVASQVYYLWLERRVLPYLTLYGILVAGILVCLAIPGVELRIHHYVIGLLLLPGTSVQTRPSLLYQGILLGLFINGVARWGFASVLQTADSLRGDGTFDSLLPVIGDPTIALSSVAGAISNITFTWDTLSGMDGISVLVNDVERLRHFFSNASSPDADDNFTWQRPADLALTEYFRIGFVKDRMALDYTPAYTWYANGTWGTG